MDVPRRRHRRRTLVVALLSVALLAAATWTLARIEPAAPEVDREMLVFTTVRRGDLPLTVRGWGELVPGAVLRLAAPAEARVAEVRVKPGSAVRTGELLVVLESPELEVALARIESEVAGARAERVRAEGARESDVWSARADAAGTKAELARLRRETERLAARVAGGDGSEAELARLVEQTGALEERLQAQNKAAEARDAAAEHGNQLLADRVDRLQRVAAGIRQRIETLRVRAPAEGLVGDLRVARGDRVAAGQPLLRLDRPERMRARVRLPGASLDALKKGQPAALVDAAGDTLRGRLVSARPDSGGAVRAEVALEDVPRGAAFRDPEVDVVVRVGTAADVLWMERPAFAVPDGLAALFVLDETGRSLGRARVRLGRGSAAGVEVLEGLREGDRVVVSDMSRFDDVDCVRIR